MDILRFFRKEQVDSVREVSLHTAGMRATHQYVIKPESGQLRLERYREVFTDGQIRMVPEKSVMWETEALVALMNECRVLRWDGFHGKHPRGVLDGIMFQFSATINGGRTIRAQGSANFPKGYLEFVQALDRSLAAE